MKKKIAFQGFRGAFSDLACQSVYPDYETVPCESFEIAFEKVISKEVDFAMIPIENSTAGRVADIHHLLPNSGLHIIQEHFQPVQLELLTSPDQTEKDLRVLSSHVHALAQVRNIIKELNLTPIVHIDTAGSAHDLSLKMKEGLGQGEAVIASPLAAKVYGLKTLRSNIADQANNITRFIVMSRQEVYPSSQTKSITTLVFRTNSHPASLYKALGGFATNAINLTKLESYLIGGNFNIAQFYVDVESHPQHPEMIYALKELSFFTDYEILGVYPAHKARGTIFKETL